MEPFNAGWLSIVPPIVAIALALITKEVLSSLVLGILTGTLIYTIGMDGNVLMGTLESAFTVMGNKVDFNILIFCSLLGALVYVVAMSGGTKAYGNWAVKRIKGRKSALAATTGLGALIFIDDYFNCLKRANINTVEDLISKTEDEMMKVRNLGRKSLEEVINKLAMMGLSLASEDNN